MFLTFIIIILDISYEIPAQIEESSIQEPVVETEIINEQPPA